MLWKQRTKLSRRKNTFRERLPLSKFNVLAFESVTKWSKSYLRGLAIQLETNNITGFMEKWVSMSKIKQINTFGRIE
jgi:hypothetical protein